MSYEANKPKRVYTMEENITDVVFRCRDANKKLDDVLLRLDRLEAQIGAGSKSPFPKDKDLPF